MSWLYTAIGYVLQFCYKLASNYGLALLLFALFFKLILFPFGYKQQKNQYRMALLRPKLMAIEKKYAGRNDQPTLRKKQMEMQELYQKEGVNPMGGCLPMLLQFPIIIALYNVIRSPMTYLMGLGKEGGHVFMNEVFKLNGVRYTSELQAMGYIRENWAFLQQFSPVKELPDFSFLGRFMDLTANPAIKSFDRYLLIPIITFASMYATMWLTQKLSLTAQTQTEQQNASMAMMNFMMPLMSTIFTFSVPVAVSIYWLYQNIFGVLQQWILYKAIPAPEFSEEDYKKAEDEYFGKNRKRKKGASADPSRPRPRSLHYIDDEEYNAGVAPAQKSALAKAVDAPATLVDGVALQEDAPTRPAPTKKKPKGAQKAAPAKEEVILAAPPADEPTTPTDKTEETNA